ncbi:hypothetical protein K9N08_00930 [Candidatus Gracilibacteria bacterium]|nr:hypothetical protein [Candidatus Gracilibacteria bacterium]MCF7856107.1 hypothetical protein [Candidatus Gracilibacteria bacterium]MCF7896526.1 hypothetical protein [Candidatus Gracilibacteria bacterium]
METLKKRPQITEAEINKIREKIATALMEKVEAGEDIFYRTEGGYGEDVKMKNGRSLLAQMNQTEKAAISNLREKIAEAIFIHSGDQLNLVRLLTQEGIQMTTRFKIEDFGLTDDDALKIKSFCFNFYGVEIEN